MCTIRLGLGQISLIGREWASPLANAREIHLNESADCRMHRFYSSCLKQMVLSFQHELKKKQRWLHRRQLPLTSVKSTWFNIFRFYIYFIDFTWQWPAVRNYYWYLLVTFVPMNVEGTRSHYNYLSVALIANLQKSIWKIFD